MQNVARALQATCRRQIIWQLCSTFQ